jgi:hypothetical protein
MKSWRPTRRVLIGGFALCGSAHLFSSWLLQIQQAHAEDSASDQNSYRVRLAIPAVHEIQVRQIISASGGTALPGTTKYEPAAGQKSNSTDPNFSPILVVVAVLTADYLADTIFRLWADAKYGGLILDARDPETMVVTENHALPRGTVVVLGDKNKVTEFTPKDKSEAGALLKEVLAKSVHVLAR